MKGAGNFQDYGMRAYDGRLGRFFSLDPLMRDYPELSPYQYASNRPIDGIDIDGLEYYSIHIKIYVDQAGNVHRSLQKIVSHRDNAKGYCNQGPGIEYVYTHERHLNTGEKYSIKANDFKENFYGVYIGPTNPLKYYENPDQKGNYKPDYILPPIDELDAAAQQHDKDYDAANAAGPFDALLNVNTIQADIDLVKRANKVIEKYKNKENDSVTGVKITENEYKKAKIVKNLFTGISVDKFKKLTFKHSDSATKEELEAVNKFKKLLDK